jgi:hypothetical protein
VDSLSPWHGKFSGCRWWRLPVDMDTSWKHSEYAVTDRWHGVIFQLWGWTRSWWLPTIINQHVTKRYTGPQTRTESLHIRFFEISISLFKNAFSNPDYTSNESMIGGWQIGKDVEGSGSGLTKGTIPAFAQGDRRKPRETSVRITGLWLKFEPGTS